MELNGNKFSEDDTNIEKLQQILSARKEEKADEYPGVDPDDEEAWGVDELDELEEESDEEDDSETEEVGAKEEKVVKDADQAESAPVPQENDQDVDDLAGTLAKTGLK